MLKLLSLPRRVLGRSLWSLGTTRREAGMFLMVRKGWNGEEGLPSLASTPC